MLRRVLDRLQHGKSSVQYEVQRRTFRGGWKNFHAEVDPTSITNFDSPPDPPELPEETDHPPGVFRCIKRVDGHIDSIVWERETPDAERYYEKRRRTARQKDRLSEMSLKDVRQELADGKPFDALPWKDVMTEIQKKTTQREGTNKSDKTDTQLRDSLVRELAGEQGPRAAMDVLLNVRRAEKGLCTYCSTKAYERCANCGELACRKHFHPEQSICNRC